jgi:hypothetical protein
MNNMFTRFITASAVSVTLAFSSAAFAASTDFIDNGDFTTDTISGLDWLDVTTTQGRSYIDVSNKFGTGEEFDGWRYATGIQFSGIVNNYIGSVNDVPPNVNQLTGYGYNPIQGLIISLGFTDRNVDWGTYDVKGITALHTWDTNKMARIYEYSDNFWRYVPNFTTTSYRTQYPEAGSFLVRDTLTTVPIPAAAFMFAPALLGFLGFRRRSKQA